MWKKDHVRITGCSPHSSTIWRQAQKAEGPVSEFLNHALVPAALRETSAYNLGRLAGDGGKARCPHSSYGCLKKKKRAKDLELQSVQFGVCSCWVEPLLRRAGHHSPFLCALGGEAYTQLHSDLRCQNEEWRAFIPGAKVPSTCLC